MKNFALAFALVLVVAASADACDYRARVALAGGYAGAAVVGVAAPAPARDCDAPVVSLPARPRVVTLAVDPPAYGYSAGVFARGAFYGDSVFLARHRFRGGAFVGVAGAGAATDVRVRTGPFGATRVRVRSR